MSECVLGNNMRVLRAKKGLTQERLAELAGVTRTTINFVENKKWIPSAHLALKIARIFEVAFEDVFFLKD